MKFVLIVGALLNLIGGVSIVVSMFVKVPRNFPKISEIGEVNPADYILFRLFTAGTAVCFGLMYIYLYLNPIYVIPFLFFGMAMKYWAFVVSLVAYTRYELPKDALVLFGFSNLVVAILFSMYLIVR
ncbi:hypothetical protein HZA56_04945 [Candidatus Poribacteria bacterium]|nr:hypothetical protein [Candidatus Poribacteria bacterium]